MAREHLSGRFEDPAASLPWRDSEKYGTEGCLGCGFLLAVASVLVVALLALVFHNIPV